MNRKKEKLYSTGEFAAYFGVKKDTLLYYDKIKLFCPAGVHRNGYRYYTAAQIAPFWTLLALREMNIPIQEIRCFFQNQSPKHLSSMAERHLKGIEAELAKLQEMKALFTQMQQIMGELEGAQLETVTIQNFLEEHLLYSRPIGDVPGSPQQWDDIYNAFARENSVSGIAYIGCVTEQDALLESRFDQIDRLYIKKKGPGSVVRPGGPYAVLYHQGNYDSIAAAYPFLISELERMGYRIAGDAYEEYLFSEFVTGNEDAYITKIAVKVSKKEESEEEK